MQPTERQVIPSSARLAILEELIGASGFLEEPTVGLYQNPAVLTPASVLADLDPADYAGYAAVVAPTWESAYIDVDGSALAFQASQTIPASGPTPANTVYGWYFANAGLTDLWAAGAFTSPVGISAPGQAVSFLPAIRYSGN